MLVRQAVGLLEHGHHHGMRIPGLTIVSRSSGCGTRLRACTTMGPTGASVPAVPAGGRGAVIWPDST